VLGALLDPDPCTEQQKRKLAYKAFVSCLW